MRRANTNTEGNTIGGGTPVEWGTTVAGPVEWRTMAPAHGEYRNGQSRTPIIDTPYVSPTIGTPFPVEIPDIEYYDVIRGRTTVQIDDHIFIFTHDVGRYFSMDGDIYSDDMVYRRLEKFAPDPKRIIHLGTPTPNNPFLIYTNRYESIGDMEQAEHILKCYSDPGVYKMGDYIILSEKQYAELDELNALLPRYSYMTNDDIAKRANDVDELIAAIKKKSKKEMFYFV